MSYDTETSHLRYKRKYKYKKYFENTIHFPDINPVSTNVPLIDKPGS